MTSLSVDNDRHSLFTPMWKQAYDVMQAVKPIMKENPDGVHLLGYSQGINSEFSQKEYFPVSRRIYTTLFSVSRCNICPTDLKLITGPINPNMLPVKGNQNLFRKVTKFCQSSTWL